MAYFWVSAGEHIQLQDKLSFSCFLIGTILCLGTSALFHTVSYHSKQMVHLFSRLNYWDFDADCGVLYSLDLLRFLCRLWLKVSYLTMIILFAIAAIIVSLNKKFNDNRYRPLRALIFSTMGLSGVIPTIHFIYSVGLTQLLRENSFNCLIWMAVFYLTRALLYAMRTPERFLPGKCDFIGQSHQLFHICVMVAAMTQYWGETGRQTSAEQR